MTQPSVHEKVHVSQRLEANVLGKAVNNEKVVWKMLGRFFLKGPSIKRQTNSASLSLRWRSELGEGE